VFCDPRFAIAGRDEKKLRALRVSMSKSIDNKINDDDVCPIIVAEQSNNYSGGAPSKSVVDMCKQANILLNCVGPYRFFGEFRRLQTVRLRQFDTRAHNRR
jgi:short subunit dehydrogenase-like uncharacterized protein